MSSNYPDGMDWGAYDDYYDPKLTCGHRSDDGCECWCLNGFHPHLVDNCDSSNCNDFCCDECGAESEEPITICKECKEEKKTND